MHPSCPIALISCLLLLASATFAAPPSRPPGVPEGAPPPNPPPSLPPPPPGIPLPPELQVPAQVATEEELIRQLETMLAEKQYQPLIQKVNKRLAPKAAPVLEHDRAAMLLLKAEAHLQLKSASQALAALEDVRTIGTAKQKAQAVATAALIKRSTALRYAPRPGAAGGEAIDILTDRAKALEALCAEELAKVAPKVKAAPPPRSLTQVLQVLSMTDTLRALEIATTGEPKETAALLAPLREQAMTLMYDAMSGMDGQIRQVQEQANRTTPQIGRDGMIYQVRAGLRLSNKAALESIQQTCAGVARASDELAPMFLGEADAFAGARQRAGELHKRAEDVLRFDYTQRIPTGKRAY